MPVSTASAAVHILPVVIKIFIEHARRRAQLIGDGDGFNDKDAQDDIFYDQAFHIVKAFIELGTRNTVESLQAYTNTHLPSPPWAMIAPICIPLSSCNQAADLLIQWFTPEELHTFIGGERWWQVRGLDGVDAEWIADRSQVAAGKKLPPSKASRRDKSKAGKCIHDMQQLDTVMFYVHGGGFFWGSINTHRYQLIHYAREMNGRVFAVNYRKAPQYPWPCPLQDVIAAYLYLIRPPKDAAHAPIDPCRICFAGDSSGGALCLSTLTVLRDLGIPLPGGAVLISPWVDLTHSFPSIIQNSATDIIPPYGFLAKPSTLWPIEPLPQNGRRVAYVGKNKHPYFGETEPVSPNHGRERDEVTEPNSVAMKSASDSPWRVDSQVQLYATNEQLVHPLVSPILQGSLGNLPPLYIVAGDAEVLRDEIIYLAHRAAFPCRYPTRGEILRRFDRQKTNSDQFQTPTKVHLRVYDGDGFYTLPPQLLTRCLDMCHVPTVFSFMKNIKKAYTQIAQFAVHQTQENHSTPESHTCPNGQNEAFAALSVNENKEFNKVPDIENSNRIKEGSKKRLDCSADPGDARSESTVTIRRRVNIEGEERVMEPEDEMYMLRIPTQEIGILKEDVIHRWKTGQEEWDRVYKHRSSRILKQRRQMNLLAERMLRNAYEQGFEVQSDISFREMDSPPAENQRRWGPLDLKDENPPPTAISGRRDTQEALALLKKHIYHSPPLTHKNVPKLKISDAIKAAFDPNDDPVKAPRQSVSEEQTKVQMPLMHGLRIWDGLLRLFTKKVSQRASRRDK